MKIKVLLASLIFLLLCSCSSTFTSLSKDDYANFSYVLPAIRIAERPNYTGIASKYYTNELNRTTALESHFNKKINIRSLQVLDSIIVDDQIELNFSDTTPIPTKFLNTSLREKLGNYYLQLLRKNPKKVKTPDWLKNILNEAKTDKITAFVLHQTYKANQKRERTDPLITNQPWQLYSIIWNKQGELLALEKSEILSEGIKEIEFGKAWKKTIFTLLKK